MIPIRWRTAVLLNERLSEMLSRREHIARTLTLRDKVPYAPTDGHQFRRGRAEGPLRELQMFRSRANTRWIAILPAYLPAIRVSRFNLQRLSETEKQAAPNLGSL